MTLRSDLAELLAGAGIVDVDIDDAVEDEHVRWAVYRSVVAVAASSCSRERDRALVAAILRDPVEMVSKSAVVELVDRVAEKASDSGVFRQWSVQLRSEIDRFKVESHREFVRRRVYDWQFYLAVKEGHVASSAELARVTRWMQRRLAEESTSRRLLTLLAESGSSKKIRNIAKNRAGSRELGTR
ncbi:hypothetical protein DSC45_05185 [Streptomyces sp. YIM 130001]|uniref:hypothetical protein n=1 Tax=Streptomyces sp. YIM 130001 TaxID=2259644 RepID=UPI000E650B72|nr:hypothetical protein [Streptomyces sp. YIM 130001]RII20601.1 hypothetical protein DSC45_05185 [Streptomyces sp. YIM 130001]